MNMAIYAKTAKERASIAIRIMKHNKNPFTRALDDCFEMGDGDEVVRLIKERAKKDPTVMAVALRLLAPNHVADLNERRQQ